MRNIRTQYCMTQDNLHLVKRITAIQNGNDSKTVNAAVKTLYDLMSAEGDGYEIFLKKKGSEEETPYFLTY